MLRILLYLCGGWRVVQALRSAVLGLSVGVLAVVLISMVASVRAQESVAAGPGTYASGAAESQSILHDVLAVMEDANDPRVLIVAHRGHHKNFPENSIASIDEAVRVGAHIVELDVRKTSDGEYVLMHDATIDRTTTSSGAVASLTFEEVRSVRLKHGIRATDHRVPTLEEAFEACRGRIMLNIDLKAGDLGEVYAIAEEMGVADLCILKAWWHNIDSDDRNELAEMPESVFMPLVRNCEEFSDALAHMYFDHVEFAPRRLSASEQWACIDLMRENGKRVWLNSLKDGPSAGLGDYDIAAGDRSVFVRLADQGVGIIQTDLPEIALEVLTESERTVR